MAEMVLSPSALYAIRLVTPSGSVDLTIWPRALYSTVATAPSMWVVLSDRPAQSDWLVVV